MLSYGHMMVKKGVPTAHHSRNNGYNPVRNSYTRPDKGSQFTTLSMGSESFIYCVVMRRLTGDLNEKNRTNQQVDGCCKALSKNRKAQAG